MPALRRAATAAAPTVGTIGRMQRAALALSIALAACGGKKKGEPDKGTGHVETGTFTADFMRCLTTLERAATMPAFERGGAIVRGCGMCGKPWDPLLTADRADTGAPVDLEAIWGVVEACGGACTNQSAGAFRNQLTELLPGKPTTKPWRVLADACPKLMHTDKASERFASGAWYALAMIGEKLHEARKLPGPEQARLDAALAAMLLPLPPLTAPGTAFIVPGGGLRPGTPWKVITVTGDAVFVGRLAFAHLSANGLQLVDGGTPYPGTRVDDDAWLATRVNELALAGAPAPPTLTDRIDEPVIIAPRAAPARLLLGAVSALGTEPTFLAVAAPAPAALWRGLVAAHPLPLLGTSTRGRKLRVGLSTPRIAVVDGHGKVLLSAPLPVPDRPMVERWAAALNAVAQDQSIEIVAEDGHVDALSQLLDAAAGSAATMAVPAPAGALLTGNEIAAFDDVKIKAKLAELPQPKDPPRDVP